MLGTKKICTGTGMHCPLGMSARLTCAWLCIALELADLLSTTVRCATLFSVVRRTSSNP